MSGSIIKLRKRAATGAAGAPSSLASSEPAYNENDNTLYYGFGDDGSGNATSVIPIAGKGAFTDLTSSQTVGGAKTFSVSPIAPTPTTGDNSTKVATTAFVQTAIGGAGGSQSANTVYAGPTTGSAAAPAFRALVAADIPSIPSSKLSDLGSANGAASLDGSGKVPTFQLPSSITGALNYKGTYDASTGVFPSSPAKGDYYVINIAGTISGHAYAIGDWITYDGTQWDYIDNQNKVSSVFGRTGAVVATSGDYTSDQVTEGSTNLYFLASRVLAVVLSGLSTATSSAITATDTVLQAFGKLQAQITTLTSTVTSNAAAALQKTNNLSDLTSPSSARTNLGLGTMATQNASAVAITGGTVDSVTITNSTINGGTF